MKKALFIGNCQNSGIIYFLNKNNYFKENYEIIRYLNYEYIKNNLDYEFDVLKKADLFVYQPVSGKHGKYSTEKNHPESLLNYLPDNCTSISYPYIYNSSLWPICQARKDSNDWFGWESIYDLLQQGADKKEIIDLYKNNKIDWQYEKRFNLTMEILKNKENICDLKITPFITKNLSDEILFLIPQHPSSHVFLYLANSILENLNLDPIIETIDEINVAQLPDSTYDRTDNMFPIHISALEFFKLKFGNLYIKDSEIFYENLIKNYLNNLNNNNCVMQYMD